MHNLTFMCKIEFPFNSVKDKHYFNNWFYSHHCPSVVLLHSEYVHVLKDILYVELSFGKRQTGCLLICYKDDYKQDLEPFNIHPATGEDTT